MIEMEMPEIDLFDDDNPTMYLGEVDDEIKAMILSMPDMTPADVDYFFDLLADIDDVDPVAFINSIGKTAWDNIAEDSDFQADLTELCESALEMGRKSIETAATRIDRQRERIALEEMNPEITRVIHEIDGEKIDVYAELDEELTFSEPAPRFEDIDVSDRTPVYHQSTY